MCLLESICFKYVRIHIFTLWSAVEVWVIEGKTGSFLFISFVLDC